MQNTFKYGLKMKIKQEVDKSSYMLYNYLNHKYAAVCTVQHIMCGKYELEEI
jgi:hypothetical protein